MADRDLVPRMIGAAMLDVATYEEVEADAGATGQAAAVVVLVAVASAVGSAPAGLGGIVAGPLAALLGWWVWSGVTYLIGDKVLGGTATWGELLRTIGFAHSPGILLVLGFLPLVGGLVEAAVRLWMLVAGILAIRQALDFSTGKAVLTAILGWATLVGVALLARSFAAPLP